MPELLLEFFCEEIPARMQQRASADLERMMNERLLAAGFMPEGVKAFAGPRRLTLVATGLPTRQPDRREEKKGPRVGAPQAAIDGFLKSAGAASIEACEVREDKKGAFYVAVVDQKGRETHEVVAEAAGDIVRAFPWPKSMRWGEGSLRWVRPLKRIMCCFNGEVVAFTVDGLVADDATEGHRIHAPGIIRARSFEKYSAALAAARVVISAEERAGQIAADARTLCQAQGLELVADDALLAEVAGLAEWPVVMMGAFDGKFLKLPDEVLTATMRGHQKYFSVRSPSTGRLANRFVFVANLEAEDGGRAMRAGYERVLTARLSDAWYLYHQDLKRPLQERVADLDRVTFFEGLGSLGDKTSRVAALAREIAPAVGADPQRADHAARLAKADLTAGMVYEFPELQGVMGRYYALAQGVDADIADAVRDHYLPKGADDAVACAPVSVAVALADKLDSLASFWAADKKPTGSSDPFALRRAALGVIATTLASATRLRLAPALNGHLVRQTHFTGLSVFGQSCLVTAGAAARGDGYGHPDAVMDAGAALAADLLAFFHDRLKVFFRDKGYRHDRIDAALTNASGAPEDDLVLIRMKLEALDAFLKTDDGANLAAGFKRAANILKAEEKRGGSANAVDPALLREPQEKALFAALEAGARAADAAVREERFGTAMAALAALRPAVDAFFDAVTVNADDAVLRANRLALLKRFIAATGGVADLSRLEG